MRPFTAHSGRRLLLAGLLSASVLGGCGSGDPASTPTPTTDGADDATAESEAEVGTDVGADGDADPSATTVAVDDGSDDVSGPEASSPPPPTGPPMPVVGDPIVAGVAPLGLLTAPSGGGDRPLLAWQDVPGATEYLVIVYDEEGAPYWSTITPSTEVVVGGVEVDPAASGPRVGDGYSWVVFASDADGLLLAASARLPIAP